MDADQEKQEKTITQDDLDGDVIERDDELLIKFKKMAITDKFFVTLKFALKKETLEEWHELVQYVDFVKTTVTSTYVKQTNNIYQKRPRRRKKREFTDMLNMVFSLVFSADIINEWYDNYLYRIEVEPADISIGSTVDTSTSITVKANVDWEISSNQSWVHDFAPDTWTKEDMGFFETKVSMDVDDNTSNKSRTAILTIKSTSSDLPEVLSATVAVK